jgi:DNA-directed RNA polymerase subunit M/transcription elongation factor TFIIS
MVLLLSSGYLDRSESKKKGTTLPGAKYIITGIYGKEDIDMSDEKEKTDVGSIREEYRTVKNTPCEKCGGKLKKVMQALMQTDEGGHVDYILAECENCGEKKEFYYGVDSFFGKPPEEQD